MEYYSNQIKDIKPKTYDRKITNPQTKKREIQKFSDDVLVLDIEVSSAWINEEGNIIGYEKGRDAEYWNSLQALALCYLWQFSYNDKVYYGRDIKDVSVLLNDIDPNIHYIIWVHNLSYEFHFLCNILEWDVVFAKTPHKPMKATCKNYPNLEFRCTYILTRLSLRTWGKDIGEYKDNPIDYEKLRTPLTPLTEDELHYGEQDCLVVYRGILKYIKRYKHAYDIPLTQTGTVRREVKKMLQADEEYVKAIKGLVPENAKQYRMLQQVFAGGYTHASSKYAGYVQKGYIEHYDFASSYPTVMIAEKYPCTAWADVSYKGFPEEERFNDYAYIFKIKFKNIRCQTFNTYIQRSKCILKNAYIDNGRVIKADELITTITEQDYLTIKDTYEWDDIEVFEIWESEKEYLPYKYVNYILELYANKTELKGIEGKEELYTQSKQYLNSLYGMSVTAIMQADVIFDGIDWSISELTIDMVNKKLKELSRSYPSERRYFLSYSWGCWVTAYARRNLWKCIESVDSDVLYCDTDSIFVLNKQDFTWYNKEVTEKLRIACIAHDIDFNRTRPKNKKGIEEPLGIFTQEEPCSEFISLGAKRYVERWIKDNKLHLTVSGINKEAVDILKDDIYNFKDGINFDKDDESVNKNLSIYITDMPEVTYPDGYHSTYKFGINMRRNGYLLSITDEYKKLINLLDQPIGELSETGFNRLKAIF